MKKILLFSIAFLTVFTTLSQEKKDKKYTIRTVGFYNLENLFDTVNDTLKNDEASPIMKIKGDKTTVYKDKLNKLASVIEQLGKEKANTSPAILGVAEVENKQVLEDLTKTDFIKEKGYEVIHFDSPDERGIDVALLYQSKYFKPIHYEAFNPNIYADNFKKNTRDILLVTGYLDEELIHVIVNHWPSRRSGQAKSNPYREKAAYKVSQIIEKIKEKEENPKIIIMGDFNDDPTNSSFKSVLKTKTKKSNVNEGDIYNPYEDMLRRGFGTLSFRDKVYLFDQIMFTSPLLDKGEKDFSSYKMFKSGIFNKQFLTTNSGKYKGYPKRSFSYGTYTGGYSDHYPVYMYLIKEAK
ncbi:MULTISPECIES: endonuclease/exonuclease/phosphatase family protein [Tenacibaculum]|uniref:endonuclease/exonuclease/phosphatase family protein n=1 Tax=Tenacibaculum TaxID=104267 RepID=UPI001F0AD84B|nr:MULTISPECIES: endonuclease/exonuclease/phosphatase family protein [Tenacibaculum]MCH3881474.1 endonuclease/exonuclease/phosphatase family protein [Tenacibaculum aquimarinum]MCH3883629.1 endonuclease/exonuclease/phosphatase family protein [Tenacibaculum aquimarinum]MDO6598932.1 endonuclease/exonuclease/phosphatase family protein [Tenacibaculum sp. 1_MG-2023]